MSSTSQTTESLSPVVSPTLLQEQFVNQISTQIYTDLVGARRLLVPFGEVLMQSYDATMEAFKKLFAGNIANLEYSFSEAVDLLIEALQLAEEEGNGAMRLEIVADLVGALINLDKVKEAAALIDANLEVATNSNSQFLWRIRVREGFLHFRLGSVEEALKCFASAKDLAPELNPNTTHVKEAYYAALLNAGLGRVFMRGGDTDRSIQAYSGVVALCSSFNMRGRLPYHYLDLGRAFMAAEMRDEAVLNLQLAVDTSGTRDKHALASALANLGYYSFLDQQWTDAAKYFDEAEHHYKTSATESNTDLSVVQLWRARMGRKRGQHELAERALIDSLTHAKKGSGRGQLAEVYLEIADYYADQKQFEDAYTYRLYFEKIQQEVNEAENEQRLSELELRHEVEERRRESQLLKLKATRLQLKALRAQMNPHFIFNALNSIQEFIVSQKATEAASHLAHFARLMRQSLDYSEREVITLEEEIDFLTNYLELNQKLRFRDEFTYSILVNEDLEEDLIGIPAMLVQPYVENAIEHGIRLVAAGHVQIEFSSPDDDEETLIISIQDNGVGRARSADQNPTKRTAHKSMGTAITKHRLELLNNGDREDTAVQYIDLVDTDGSPAGTRVVITLPISWQH